MDAIQVPPIQQQQRPSLPYFLCLSLLFFLVSNNGPANNSNGAERDDAQLHQLQQHLNLTRSRRAGLAEWLTEPSNVTAIPFLPTFHSNVALLPEIQQLLKREDGTQYYHQNLTGFVKGIWRAEERWDYAALGLDEAYNTTVLREETKYEENQRLEKSLESDVPIPPPELSLGRRQESPDTTRNESVIPPPSRLVNVTITTNRTTSRLKFPFNQNGKIVFNLREEQSTVVGPILPVPTGRDGIAKEGEVVRVREPTTEWERAGPASWLRGDVTISSPDGKDDYVLDVEGVHYLTQGTIFAYLTPAYLPSRIFDVPTLSKYDNSTERANRNSLAAGHVVLAELDRRIERERKDIGKLESGVGLANDGDEGTGPLCSFVLYGSIAPLPRSYIPHLYAEHIANLFHPTGSSLAPPPPPVVAYTLYSESCGLVISGEGAGVSSMRLWERATTFANMMTLVQAALCWFLVQQMEWGSGAGMAVKVSYLTIGMQAAIDCYFFILTFTVGLVTSNRASLPLLVTAFFSIVSSLLFGMRYTAIIRAAAPPPSSRAVPFVPPPPPPPTQATIAADAAERRANAEQSEAASTEEGADAPLLVVLPVAGVGGTTAVPIVNSTGNQDDRFYLWVGGVSAFVGLSVIYIWGWLPLMVVLLYSYWIPQIILNAQRGTARMSLRRDYVISSTLLRLVLPLYVWGCPSNVLSIEATGWSILLAFYSLAQMAVVLMQNSRFGARFFIPEIGMSRLGLRDEQVWDYHPILPSSDDLEGGRRGKEDCPICMEEIVFESKEDREIAGKGGARWGYMVPPCHHIAHTNCLTSWLAIKSVCPVCRRQLPPL